MSSKLLSFMLALVFAARIAPDNKLPVDHAGRRAAIDPDSAQLPIMPGGDFSAPGPDGDPPLKAQDHLVVEVVGDARLQQEAAPLPSEAAATRVSKEVLSVPYQVTAQLSQDPLALTCSALLVMYLLGQVMIKPFIRKGKMSNGKNESPLAKEREPSSSPATRETKKLNVRKQAKSSVAVAINQQLTALGTVEEVLACALSFTGQMDIVNVVTAIHRSTKLALAQRKKNLAQDPRLADLLRQLQNFFEEDMQVSILTRAVGNTSWALAKLSFKEADGVEGTASSILEILHHNFTEYAEHFKPEELMNTVWAFAELSKDTPESAERALGVARAAVRCAKRFPSFTLQQVVYFAWALARLSSNNMIRSDPEVQPGLALFKRLIMERVEPGMDCLTTKNLAMISWAVAHLQKVKSEIDLCPLLQRVVQEAKQRGFDTFNPGELASIIWALSKCQVVVPEFFKEFRDYILKKGFKGFSSQDLANVVCAYVNADAGDDVFYTLLGQQVQKNAAQFNKLEKTMVNWAFGQLPHISAPKIGS